MLPAALLTLAVLAAPAAGKAKPATNTKDPVCKMTVDAKSATVAVRGREYRVCSKYCGEALQKDPDKYLDKDGSVKAEKK
ncbi:YHS domain-containing protein [Geothrix fermentans]|jgi:YHS domain-containing protein|uniref:YHS domain-containing protein n=1 Tax=Geothrix fermentans TaxID=44676 RepID=UPI000401C7E2|nr:YHS domain-containing protein [Geothrix fermentans]